MMDNPPIQLDLGPLDLWIFSLRNEIFLDLDSGFEILDLDSGFRERSLESGFWILDSP